VHTVALFCIPYQFEILIDPIKLSCIVPLAPDHDMS
jgi:hypothetical protein